MTRKQLASIDFPRLLIWTETILLVGMAPLFVFPRMNRIWPLAVFPLLWIARWWIEKHDKRRSRWPVTPLDAAVVLLVIQLLISSIAAGDWAAMLPKIFGILYGILVFYALVQLLWTDRLAGIGISIFVCGGMALSIFGLVGMFIVKEPYFQHIVRPILDKIPRHNWAFEGAEAGLNPNAVAGTMVLFMPICILLALWWSKNSKSIPFRLGPPAGPAIAVICGLLSLFLLLILFLTQAVASWLALAAGLWLVLPSRKAKIIAVVPAVIVAATIAVFLPQAGAEDTENREIPYVQKVKGRHLRWVVGIDAVREKPLTGVGINMLRQRPELGYERAHAHNQMLHTAAELGIPGLMAYLAVLSGALVMCISVWRRPGPAWIAASARGLAAGQAAHFIFGWGDSIPLGAKPGIFFWVSLALISALYIRDKNNSFLTKRMMPNADDKQSVNWASAIATFFKKPLGLPILLAVAGVALLSLILLSIADNKKMGSELGTRRVLCFRSMASIISESPGQTDKIRADRLISGGPGNSWRSLKGSHPPFVFVFALATDSWINRLAFINSDKENEFPGIGAHKIEVEFSMSGPDSAYSQTGVFELAKGGEIQQFLLPRMNARWIRLTIHSNHGHPDFTELDEFEVWGNFNFHMPLLISYFIWIVGAAVLLAAFGWHQYLARCANISLRDALRLPTFMNPAKVGAALIAAGVLASAVGENARVPVLAAMGTIGGVFALFVYLKSANKSGLTTGKMEAEEISRNGSNLLK